MIAEKQPARSPGDARIIADNSYLEATLVLVDDLLKELTPTAMVWINTPFTEACSIPDGASTSQRGSDANASWLEASLPTSLQPSTEKGSGCDIGRLSSSDFANLEVATSVEDASRGQDCLARAASLDCAVEQSGACCESESARGNNESDIQKVRRAVI